MHAFRRRLFKAFKERFWFEVRVTHATLAPNYACYSCLKGVGKSNIAETNFQCFQTEIHDVKIQI
jgi:hypothetical protein